MSNNDKSNVFCTVRGEGVINLPFDRITFTIVASSKKPSSLLATQAVGELSRQAQAIIANLREKRVLIVPDEKRDIVSSVTTSPQQRYDDKKKECVADGFKSDWMQSITSSSVENASQIMEALMGVEGLKVNPPQCSLSPETAKKVDRDGLLMAKDDLEAKLAEQGEVLGFDPSTLEVDSYSVSVNAPVRRNEGRAAPMRMAAMSMEASGGAPEIETGLATVTVTLSRDYIKSGSQRHA